MGRTHRRIRRHLTDGAESLFRLAALCVLLTLWTGPLPWIHRHTPTVDVNQAQTLASHLSDWHDGARSIRTGWHLHFATLDNIVRGRGCPAAPRSNDDELPIVGSLSVESSTDSGFVLARMSPFLQPIADKVSHPATMSLEQGDLSLRRQFLSDFAQSRRLKIVLCVDRC